MRKWGFIFVALGMAVVKASAAEVSLEDVMTQLRMHSWTATYAVPASSKSAELTVQRYDRDASGKFSDGGGSGLSFGLGGNGPALKRKYEVRILIDDTRTTLFVDKESGAAENGKRLPASRSWGALPSRIGDGVYLLYSGRDGTPVFDYASVDADGTLHMPANVATYTVLKVKSSP